MAAPSPQLMVPEKSDPTAATINLVADKFTTATGIIQAVEAKLDIRIASVEKANELFREDLTRVPTNVDRATKQLREVLIARFKSAKKERELLRNEFQTATIKLHELIQAKLDASETDRGLLRQEIDRQMHTLREFHDARFAAFDSMISVFKVMVDDRFQLSDVQTDKAARDVKSAVDAAFAAAKEAVGEQNKSNALSITKSETAFTKQIDQLADSVKSIVKNTDDKIDAIQKTADDKFTNLKDRLGALETRITTNEGRASLVDPQTFVRLAELTKSVDSLQETRAGNDSGSQAGDRIWGIVAAFIAAGTAIALVVVEVIRK